MTLNEAIELLKQPKAQRRGFGAPREPLKVFEVSPVTGKKVELREGRYGMYVTDGETNASIPKNTPPEEVTFDMAVSLLKERADAGPLEEEKGPAPQSRPTHRRLESRLVAITWISGNFSSRSAIAYAVAWLRQCEMLIRICAMPFCSM